MAKLTEKEREAFERILSQDLLAINMKFMNQLKDFWSYARDQVKHIRGYDKLEEERDKLNEEIRKCQERIHEIEGEMHSESLTPEQIVELGGKANEYGRFSGAKFYGIPVEGQFDYAIVEYIRKNIDIEIPAKIIRDICSASLRELTMAGTFEEAREAYQKFYSLDFRKYGVDIPPRLSEIMNDARLISSAQKSVSASLTEQKKENLFLQEENK
jgi:hypothetical protein